MKGDGEVAGALLLAGTTSDAGKSVLGDLVANHLDTAALERLMDGGPPPGLPVVWPAGSRRTS